MGLLFVPANSNNNIPRPNPPNLTGSHNCKYHPYRIKLQLIVKLQQNSSNSSHSSTPQQAQRRHNKEVHHPQNQDSTTIGKHENNISESQQKVHKEPQQLPTPASLETNSFHKPPKRPMKIHKNHKEQKPQPLQTTG